MTLLTIYTIHLVQFTPPTGGAQPSTQYVINAGTADQAITMVKQNNPQITVIQQVTLVPNLPSAQSVIIQ